MTHVFDGGVKLFEGPPKRPWQRVGGISENRSVRSKDAPTQLAVEESDATTVWRENVGMRLGSALDQSATPEPWEVVRHLTGGIGSAEQRGDT